MLPHDLILVHGIFYAPHSSVTAEDVRNIRAAREETFTKHAEALGVSSYQWVDGAGRELANTLLRKLRGTAPAVDAVEIIELNAAVTADTLASTVGQELWREVANCRSQHLDTARSFILIGAPRQLLDGTGGKQRIIWFGNGLEQLSREEFITHYTTRHGPLVAGHAQLIGLRRYRQVPDEQDALCCDLRKLGFGKAPPPATFAELVMGAPPLKLSALRARRAAAREIKADEKRHIQFSKSMLLMSGK